MVHPVTSQKNNGPFHFDCKEIWGRKKNLLHVREKR